ncbi:MAG: ABC transporter substrate-binding protein, partial [Pseudolabrys sp.]
MKLSRRSVLRATAATVAAPALGILGAASPIGRASGETQIWRHALSLFGDIKYPEGFKHFDYVNPNAPQGGTLRQSALGTFDNDNTVVSGVKGSIAIGTELYTETLTTPTLDEVSTEYG